MIGSGTQSRRNSPQPSRDPGRSQAGSPCRDSSLQRHSPQMRRRRKSNSVDVERPEDDSQVSSGGLHRGDSLEIIGNGDNVTVTPVSPNGEASGGGNPDFDRSGRVKTSHYWLRILDVKKVVQGSNLNKQLNNARDCIMRELPKNAALVFSRTCIVGRYIFQHLGTELF